MNSKANKKRATESNVSNSSTKSRSAPKLSSRNYGFQLPGIPVCALTPTLNQNELGLERLQALGKSIQKVAGTRQLDANTAYIYTLLLMSSWVQTMFIFKRLKPQFKPQDFQKFPTHQMYTNVLSSDTVLELQALYTTYKCVPHITSQMVQENGGNNETFAALFYALMERKGSATKKVNPKQDWGSLLKWGRGHMISLRGTWQTTPYFGNSKVIFSPYANPAQATIEGFEEFNNLLISKETFTNENFELAKSLLARDTQASVIMRKNDQGQSALYEDLDLSNQNYFNQNGLTPLESICFGFERKSLHGGEFDSAIDISSILSFGQEEE